MTLDFRQLAPAVLALTAAVVLWCATPAPARAQDPDLGNPDTYSFSQQFALMLINQERRREGLAEVKLDPVASQAAKDHADDMLAGSFFSHWNRAGDKPTRRYNRLGGYHNLSENIYMLHSSGKSIEAHLELMIKTLMDSPGHRRAILDPSFTHVGLGFSLSDDGEDFYGVQEFINRIGGEYSCPLEAMVGQRVRFQGRYDPRLYSFAQVTVGYEERAVPRDRGWLAKTGSYSNADKTIAGYIPDQRARFDGMQTYHDVTIDDDQGRFTCNALMDYKGKAGLYYLFLWLDNRQTGRTVLAAVATVDVRR